MVQSGRKSNSSKILCMSSLPASIKRIGSKTTEKRWRQRFPYYKSMGPLCCHRNQSFKPICPKTLRNLSPTLMMLHIKFDQHWPTGLRDIEVSSELSRNDRLIEWQNSGRTRQIQYSPHFSKRGYNYRPVSILPTVSKIYERSLEEQLSKYFEQLFYPYLSFSERIQLPSCLIGNLWEVAQCLGSVCVYGGVGDMWLLALWTCPKHSTAYHHLSSKTSSQRMDCL